ERTARAIATLRAVPWLASLGEASLAEMIESGDLVTFAPGEALVRELELGDELFVIIDGELVASVAAGLAAPLTVGTLKAGDTCGELSMFTRELRSATVTATAPVEALRLHRYEFDALVDRHPRIAVHFASEIGARLADTDRALDGLLSTKGPRDA